MSSSRNDVKSGTMNAFQWVVTGLAALVLAGVICMAWAWVNGLTSEQGVVPSIVGGVVALAVMPVAFVAGAVRSRRLGLVEIMGWASLAVLAGL
ncbi:MAG: hypothetical protein GY809_05280, partial [Planctomycetes bacterium]|nr:hypothetical protein [Planctomycetota bacterium]